MKPLWTGLRWFRSQFSRIWERKDRSQSRSCQIWTKNRTGLDFQALLAIYHRKTRKDFFCWWIWRNWQDVPLPNLVSCNPGAEHHCDLRGFDWACMSAITGWTDGTFHVQDSHWHSCWWLDVPYCERKSACWTSQSSRRYHLWWMFNDSSILLWSAGSHPSGHSRLPKTIWRTDDRVQRGLLTDSSCHSRWFTSRHCWGVLTKIIPVEFDGSAALASQYVFATHTWSSRIFPMAVGHWTWPYCGWCWEHRNSTEYDHLQWRSAHRQYLWRYL